MPTMHRGRPPDCQDLLVQEAGRVRVCQSDWLGSGSEGAVLWPERAYCARPRGCARPMFVDSDETARFCAGVRFLPRRRKHDSSRSRWCQGNLNFVPQTRANRLSWHPYLYLILNKTITHSIPNRTSLGPVSRALLRTAASIIKSHPASSSGKTPPHPL